MIIWINGSFGSGKTTVATRLNEIIEESHIYDPEEAGFYLRSNLPKEMVESDFQDIALWRLVNYQVIAEAAKNYPGTLIVPMTLVNPQYFDEIVGRLRNENIEIYHFFLKASADTLKQRLTGRGEAENAWVFNQIDRCVNAVESNVFETYIDTENRTVDEISNLIIQQSSLSSIHHYPANEF